MITGAVIFFIGLIVGYLAKGNPRLQRPQQKLNSLISRKAKIVDLEETNPLDVI